MSKKKDIYKDDIYEYELDDWQEYLPFVLPYSLKFKMEEDDVQNLTIKFLINKYKYNLKCIADKNEHEEDKKAYMRENNILKSLFEIVFFYDDTAKEFINNLNKKIKIKNKKSK